MEALAGLRGPHQGAMALTQARKVPTSVHLLNIRKANSFLIFKEKYLTRRISHHSFPPALSTADHPGVHWWESRSVSSPTIFSLFFTVFIGIWTFHLESTLK